MLISLVFSYSILMALINGVNNFIEKAATTSRFRYGKIRIWGALGFAFGAQISGILYQYIGMMGLFVLYILSVFLCIFGISGIKVQPLIQPEKRQSNKHYSVIFSNQQFVLYVFLTFLFYGITNVSGTYITPMFIAEGLSVSQTTFILFLSTMMELPIIFFSHLFMDKLTNRQLLVFIFLLLTVQYFTYASGVTLLIKIIVTVICKNIVTMTFIMINLKIVNSLVKTSYQMSALAIISMSKNISSVLLQLTGAKIVATSNYAYFYLLLAVIAFVGGVGSCFIRDGENTDKMFE